MLEHLRSDYDYEFWPGVEWHLSLVVVISNGESLTSGKQDVTHESVTFIRIRRTLHRHQALLDIPSAISLFLFLFFVFLFYLLVNS